MYVYANKQYLTIIVLMWIVNKTTAGTEFVAERTNLRVIAISNTSY